LVFLLCLVFLMRRSSPSGRNILQRLQIAFPERDAVPNSVATARHAGFSFAPPPAFLDFLAEAETNLHFSLACVHSTSPSS
jgi:hypothetical protein